MIGLLFRCWTRGLRRRYPHMFDGALASEAVREALVEEGFGAG